LCQMGRKTLTQSLNVAMLSFTACSQQHQSTVELPFYKTV